MQDTGNRNQTFDERWGAVVFEVNQWKGQRSRAKSAILYCVFFVSSGIALFGAAVAFAASLRLWSLGCRLYAPRQDRKKSRALRLAVAKKSLGALLASQKFLVRATEATPSNLRDTRKCSSFPRALEAKRPCKEFTPPETRDQGSSPRQWIKDQTCRNTPLNSLVEPLDPQKSRFASFLLAAFTASLRGSHTSRMLTTSFPAAPSSHCLSSPTRRKACSRASSLLPI